MKAVTLKKVRELQNFSFFASSAVCEKLASNDDFDLVVR